ncbi:PQQ-binding-like beta-propeller repeat protein [Cellulosimicrobium cellulans]|uniref:outer membrane protein assembly factor BamB family protein n=1 Tax=Cellulosimicrobium cellulans TaxID=1710 RepID=UPI00130DB77B|nr:PQQ-binding-like beta-propeller repeat protein [Cellulosimicrobium cellulans]
MGAGGMAEVLLEDAGGPPPDPREPEHDRARRARALLRRWWPLPVAGVLAVVAWQSVTDARTESAAERLRATPGVIDATVTAPLDVTSTGSPELAGALFSGTRTQQGDLAGLVLGTGTGPGAGPASVLGLDPATGEEVWRVDVADPPPADLTSRGGDCRSGDDGPARTLWCVITDSRDLAGTASATRLVEVHLGDHAVRSTRDLAPGAAATPVGDATLVVGTPAAESVRLVATDVSSGEQLWATEVPEPILSPGSSTGWLSRAGSHVLVATGRATWAVDAGTGRVQAGGAGLEVARGDRLVDVQGSSRTLLLGVDGSGTAEADGQARPAAPDDGSAPGVLVVEVNDGSLQRLLRGVDAASGAVLWERPADGMSGTNQVLLDGVLYGSGATTVWAVDAETGEERWRAEGARLRDFRLMTDGVHLLRVERDPESGVPVLAAYRLVSGGRAWATPLPPGVDSVWTQGGILYGQGDDGVVVLR